MSFNGWRLISDDNIARRLIGDDKIQVAGVLDFVNGNNSITDIKIGLNTNLTGMTNYDTKTETDSIVALKAPINNPTCTGALSLNGTLSCPQLNPQMPQTKFNTIKPPGLYHYDGGLANAPSSSLNFRSIEVGREDRYSQIALPWDADQMFFRRQQSNEQCKYFTPWVEVVHSGNISTFIQPALRTKQNKLTFLLRKILTDGV